MCVNNINTYALQEKYKRYSKDKMILLGFVAGKAKGQIHNGASAQSGKQKQHRFGYSVAVIFGFGLIQNNKYYGD